MNKKRIAQKLAAMALVSMMSLQLLTPVASYAASNDKETIKAPNAMVQMVQNDDLEIGQVYEGFKLDKQIFSKDLNAKVNLFVHEKNGGQVVYIQNNDKNKWFGATFRTPTVDNTGVNHVLEHTVLEGSKKYPSASNFKDMSKRSVSTFMNALTGSDLTYYPVASENSRDFDNLMRVYLDAVFAPNVVTDHRLMQREGWRYDLNPETQEIEFNGIVFNEMKGAMSGRYKVLFTEAAKALYPDTKYKFNSGGDPVDIVDLTQEHIAETHNKYYTASNACLMLYGDLNIVEKLRYINNEYYNNMEKTEAINDSKIQPKFNEVKVVQTTYPAAPNETPEKDSILLWTTIANDTTAKDRMGLAILAGLLAKDDHSPMYKSIVEGGFGNTIYSQMNTTAYQQSLMIIAEGASNEKLEEFSAEVEKTLREVSKKGFSKNELEATFNQYELALKDSLLRANKGEIALNSLNDGFVTYGDPLISFNEADILKEIRKEALEDGYLEKLIDKYLLNHSNLAKIAFKPDAKYMANMNAKLDEKLQARLKSMTEEQINQLKEDAKEYSNWQSQTTPQEHLDKLPKLNVSDLDLEMKKHNMINDKLENYTLLKHPVNSLGLTDLTLYFNLKNLTQEELEYLPLLSALIGNADNEKYNNEELSNLIRKYSLGINFYQTCYGDDKDLNKYYPFFIVKSTYSSENASEVTQLAQDIMLKTKLDDKELMKVKLQELVDGMKRARLSDANSVAASRFVSTMNAKGAFNDLFKNKSYVTLVNINDDFDARYPELLKIIETIYGKIFTADELTISIASEEKDFEINENAVKNLLKDLNKKEIKDNEWKFDLKPIKLGMTIPAEVQYIQMGFNLQNIGEKATGSDLVFSKLLSDGYMYEKLRLQGGAYGGYLSTSINGTVRFGTYRDPKLKESVDVINNAVKYLKTYKPTQEEINNAIISIAGRIDQGKSLFSETGEANAEYLSEYDRKDLERIKQEIIATKAEDLQIFIKKLEKGLKDSTIVIAGSKTQIENNKNLFNEIKSIDA